jgi:putative transposase
MSTRRYHLHSTEFKIRLVQSYLAGEGTLKGLARKHGIYHSLLRLWVCKYQRGHFDERDSLVEKVDEYEPKIASLERKVGQFTMAVILDAWSRRVVGYAVSRHLDTQLTFAARTAAVSSRKPGPGLIHHSDRGSQYAATQYRDSLKKLYIQGS